MSQKCHLVSRSFAASQVLGEGCCDLCQPLIMIQNNVLHFNIAREETHGQGIVKSRMQSQALCLQRLHVGLHLSKGGFKDLHLISPNQDGTVGCHAHCCYRPAAHSLAQFMFTHVVSPSKMWAYSDRASTRRDSGFHSPVSGISC